jgi:tetratricopeptide (TPR) repeat protein
MNLQAILNLSLEHHKTGRYHHAIDGYLQVLTTDPNHFDSHRLVASAYASLDQHSSALPHLRAAIAIKPESAMAQHNLALTLVKLQQPAEAIEHFTIALELDSPTWETYQARADAFMQLKNYAQAAQDYQNCLALNPVNFQARLALGNCFLEQKLPAQALVHFAECIKLDPNNANAICNLGTAYYETRDFVRAAELFTRAIELDPSLNIAKYNLACCHLIRKDFISGFELYEARHHLSEAQPRLKVVRQRTSQPLLQPRQHITDKRLYIYYEQGLGDTVQFARYLQPLKELGAYIIFECQTPLKPLFQFTDGIDTLICPNDPVPAHDLHCPLLSLPLMLGNEVTNIPTPLSFHKPGLITLGNWATRFKTLQRPLIGICWRGSNSFGRDVRSMPLVGLLPFLPKQMQYISVQKEHDPMELAILNASNIPHFGDEQTDLAMAAALLLQLDAVISIDTSVPHLAASLNIPTFLLLPYTSEWRWFSNDESSPWYPSMTILRQNTPHDWNSTLLQLNKYLFGLSKRAPT